MSFVIETLKKALAGKDKQVHSWFEEQHEVTKPFFYCSVDLRHSGHKLAPVDTNLFPAGFNNLSEKEHKNGSDCARQFLAKYHPGTKSVLIIAENATRNLYYLDNLVALEKIFTHAGIETRLAGLENNEILQLTSHSGAALTIHPITRTDDRLEAGRLVPDLIIVNNDLTTGAPEILRQIAQPVLPPVGVGWYRRRKTTHFDTYADVATRFSQQFSFDKWLIASQFHKCGMINFKEKTGLECVALGVERVLSAVQKKYDEYGIKEAPYVFIKANSGTYGMGIMTARSPEEVLEINKNERKKMDVIKGGTHNTEVIIQEGIPTIDRIDGKVAEPMLYLIGGQTVGCSYRVNENRDAFSNLNSKGMSFSHACEQDSETHSGSIKDLCPMQSLVARLAALAATRENYEENWDI